MTTPPSGGNLLLHRVKRQHALTLAEIRQKDAHTVPAKNIIRFDVPVANSIAVKVLQRLQQLRHVHAGNRLGDMAVEPLAERMRTGAL